MRWLVLVLLLSGCRCEQTPCKDYLADPGLRCGWRWDLVVVDHVAICKCRDGK